MIKLKKILCPVDFSKCSEVALENAYYLANIFADELHIFHAILLYEDGSYKPDDRLPENIVSYDLIEEISHQKLNNLISKDKNKDLKVVTACSRGFSAADEILTYAEENQVDLIMMGTHGRSALSHFLLGSVAERVVRMATCPVMTFRKTAKGFGNFKKILVPVDFSDYSKVAVHYALEIAQQFEFSITLFHSFEQQFHPAFYAGGKTSLFEIDPGLKQRAFEAMEKFRKEFGYPDVKTEYEFAEGTAYHEIIEHTKKKNYDMLIIASHGLKGLEHFLIGSTTEKVIRHVDIPVLTIKPPKATSNSS